MALQCHPIKTVLWLTADRFGSVAGDVHKCQVYKSVQNMMLKKVNYTIFLISNLNLLYLGSNI